MNKALRITLQAFTLFPIFLLILKAIGGLVSITFGYTFLDGFYGHFWGAASVVLSVIATACVILQDLDDNQ